MRSGIGEKRKYERRGHVGAEERALCEQLQQCVADEDWFGMNGIIWDLEQRYAGEIEEIAQRAAQVYSVGIEEARMAARARFADIVTRYDPVANLQLQGIVGLWFRAESTLMKSRLLDTGYDLLGGRGRHRSGNRIVPNELLDRIADTRRLDLESAQLAAVHQRVEYLARRLPNPHQRYVIEARFWRGMSLDETADEGGVFWPYECGFS